MADKQKKEYQATLKEGQTRSELLAELSASTIHRNALPMMGFPSMGFGGADQMEVKDMMAELAKSAGKVRSGNLDDLTDMLTSQAMVMDAMFTEYSRRAMVNMTDYPLAVDRYMGFAFKAQNQCRMTLETLARVKRGGKQTVKVVHVHEGGQAVVAENFNAGDSAGGKFKNEDSVHEQHSQSDGSAAMLGYDEAWNELPATSDARKETVQSPRRQIDGSARK